MAANNLLCIEVLTLSCRPFAGSQPVGAVGARRSKRITTIEIIENFPEAFLDFHGKRTRAQKLGCPFFSQAV